ncbi:hypothetical protein KZZ07_08010 [Mameliella sp. CS4]|nr:hypothetical protein [Mameliella sp. CS4]MBW4982483.1 hypothetical protein [Mameliella sp. CS4]
MQTAPGGGDRLLVMKMHDAAISLILRQIGARRGRAARGRPGRNAAP